MATFPARIDSGNRLRSPRWDSFTSECMASHHFHCTLLHCASQMFVFVLFFFNKGKTLHQQKHCNSLYCNTCFTAMVWHRTCSASKVWPYPSATQTFYIYINMPEYPQKEIEFSYSLRCFCCCSCHCSSFCFLSFIIGRKRGSNTVRRWHRIKFTVNFCIWRKQI